MKPIYYIFLYVFLVSNTTYTQNKLIRVNKEDSAFFSKPYPYILPILGDKVHEKKYKMPMPFGLSVNVLSVEQKMKANNMQVGFGNINNIETNGRPELIDISEIVDFNQIVAKANVVNLRADFYPLPFLNLYTIVGLSKSKDVRTKLIKPFTLPINTTASTWFYGLGSVLSGKIGPVFLSFNYNYNVNKGANLRKPIKVNTFGIRSGPVFNLKKGRKLEVWVGTMFTKFKGETLGTAYTNQLAPNAPEYVGNMIDDLNEWYDNLSPLDKLKFKIIHDFLEDGLENIQENIDDTFIDYSIVRTQNRPWNMILGTQLEVADHWKLRTEGQFLGDRVSIMLSLEYRFGIKGKTLFSCSN